MPERLGTFREEIPEKLRKDPGNALSERFLEFPLKTTARIPPNPIGSRHLKPPKHFQDSLPPSTAGDASFFPEVVPERASLRAFHSIPSSTGGTSGIWGATGHISRDATSLLAVGKLPAYLRWAKLPIAGEIKVSTSTVAALLSKMALTGQRIAVVDVVFFLVSTAFCIYLPAGVDGVRVCL